VRLDSHDRDPKWQAVLAALKLHDYRAAESALANLAATGTSDEREAASLSLAEVLLARGRVTEARARFERLSKSARSALVREKARAVLADGIDASDRSPSTAPATH
jgi:hypothetical protein